MGTGGGESDTAEPDPAVRLRGLRRALAAMENLETEAAVDQFQTLASSDPGDAATLRNLMLARLLRIDQLSETALSPMKSAEEQSAARIQIPDLLDAARENAARLMETAKATDEDRAIARWVDARVTAAEATLLPPSMTRSIRRDLIDSLASGSADAETAETSRGPAADAGVIGGGLLLDTIERSADPIDGLPPDLARTAANAALALATRHDDNLYFQLAAARLAIDDRRPAAADRVRRIGALVTAIKPAVARDTAAIGKTPDELIDDIVSAIGAERWSDAGNQMALLFNVLNGTELVRTDRKRSDPHPLDLISLRSLRAAAAAAAIDETVRPSAEPLVFDADPSARQDPAAGPPTATALVDADLDLRPDIAAVTDGRLTLRMATGGAPVQTGVNLVGYDRVLFAADLFVVDSSYRIRADAGGGGAARHNTYPQLVAGGPSGLRLLEIDGRGDAPPKVSAVDDADNGLTDLADVTAAIAVDAEADGDLDLFVVAADRLRLYVNRGNRTFFEAPLDASSFDDNPPTAMAIADLDRDLDIDLVTTHADGTVGLVENLLHLQFRTRTLPIDPIPGLEYLAVEDFDGDVAWDLLLSAETGGRVVYGRTESIGAWSVDDTTPAPGGIVVHGDLDNDSYFEAMTADGRTVRIDARGVTDRGDVEITGRPVAADDIDGDGILDLVLTSPEGSLPALNRSNIDGHHLSVRFRGIDDNASGRVNHYAVGSVLESRFGPHYRARIITRPATHFGIDGYDTADVRAILPNGLTQTRRDVAADSMIEEEQTLKGSCPYLFAGDGDRMRFVTDCLWAAPLGLQVAPGVVVPDRPWEYLKIEGRNIRPTADGVYDFRITEELWEIAYFDQVSLTAVDHPADVEVWTNEKVAPPHAAQPRTFAFRRDQTHPPRHAADTDGNEVTRTLSKTDDVYVKGFDRRLVQGLCPPHHIDLTFPGPPKPTNDQPPTSADGASDPRRYLVLTGWILPTDTSLNIQIDQNPELPSIVYPQLLVPDPTSPDGWRVVIDSIGFPGGKTKTMVVDVTDVLDPTEPRCRIRTTAQIYWDAAALVSGDASDRVIETPLTMLTASLGEHGYSRPIRRPDAPDRYDYDDATSAPRWPPLRGPRTEFGDCRDLLTNRDDAMVVMASGDEIRMTFDAGPPPPPGWVRDFVLHNVGWDKDADLNTLTGQSTLPLPSRVMPTYPPPMNQAANNPRHAASRLDRTIPMQTFWTRPPWHRPPACVVP